MLHWKSVGVLGKPQALEQSLDSFQALSALFSKWKISSFYETSVGKLLKLPEDQCLDTEALIKKCELIIVVGGDGSMLNAAHLAVQYDKPLLGVNRGRLGFLTDIGPEELEERLHRVLEGEFSREERILLEGKIEGKSMSHIALNDIVLSSGVSSQLIEFDLWIDDTFVWRQRGDGLIISTPTGSTAYALSAGGPILHPSSAALAIVPMLPHKLTSRPIVVSRQAKMKLVLCSQGPARISFDSQYPCDLFANESVNIQAYAKKIQLIHPKDYNYFKTLRDKLHWESR